MTTAVQQMPYGFLVSVPTRFGSSVRFSFIHMEKDGTRALEMSPHGSGDHIPDPQERRHYELVATRTLLNQGHTIAL